MHPRIKLALTCAALVLACGPLRAAPGLSGAERKVVAAAQAEPGSELEIDVRGKARRARVVKKPIYRKES